MKINKVQKNNKKMDAEKERDKVGEDEESDNDNSKI